MEAIRWEKAGGNAANMYRENHLRCGVLLGSGPSFCSLKSSQGLGVKFLLFYDMSSHAFSQSFLSPFYFYFSEFRRILLPLLTRNLRLVRKMQLEGVFFFFFLLLLLFPIRLP